MPLAAFTDSRHVKAEEAIYASSCKCSQLVEAHRAALHASLERVLVIDIRFRWNGLGNSLERWERLLRVGLAAGRATFLQMSDQQHPLFDLGEHFDWGVCIEVAEHIAREAEDTFLANLARHVDHLVISWAVEGQGGTGHVNCRDPPDAAAALRRHGFALDVHCSRNPPRAIGTRVKTRETVCHAPIRKGCWGRSKKKTMNKINLVNIFIYLGSFGPGSPGGGAPG